jgi:hypothetical protein
MLDYKVYNKVISRTTKSNMRSYKVYRPYNKVISRTTKSIIRSYKVYRPYNKVISWTTKSTKPTIRSLQGVQILQ